MNLKDLKLEALAIGSLPHNDVKQAMRIVEKDFSAIPFFPQLANVSRNEDMLVQFLEGLPLFNPDCAGEYVFDIENPDFLQGLEEFFTDWEDIINDKNFSKLEKYAVTEDFSSAFGEFENLIKKNKPAFAKGQIAGPFTLASSMYDKNGHSVVFDETLRDFITKFLSLKALWQINRIKLSNPQTVPIIFMDEPSVTQLGTSAYITVSQDDVVSMLKEISNVIKSNGAISAVHCCGKCDWRIPIKSGVDIINLDAYSYSKNFGIYSKEIKRFLEKGSMIAWGLVPTLDGALLDKITLTDLISKFEKSVKYLTKKGIGEKLVVDGSIITSSCGAGSLTPVLAQKAMDLVCELSKELKARF